MFKIHDRVIIQADQAEDNLTGVIVGQARVVIDQYDPFHSSHDFGQMRTYAVVRLDQHHKLARSGEDDTLVDAHATVGELCVDFDNLVNGPWFVNVYEVWQHSGGPEEGGWWYNSFSHQHTEAYETYSDAVAGRDKMRETDWVDTGRASSVVYDGGEYMLTIDPNPGKDFDNYQPWS